MDHSIIAYNKLVRDRIPEIIRSEGKECDLVKLRFAEEYKKALIAKLYEELKEYEESSSIEELVDISEVISALAVYHGLSGNEFKEVVEKKRDERGGFKERWFLRFTSDYIWKHGEPFYEHTK